MNRLVRFAALIGFAMPGGIASAQIVLNFDALPGVNYVSGTFINPSSRVSNNYLAANGVLFASGGGYVGVVNIAGAATSQPNGISGSTPGNLVTYGQANPISATFWVPSNPSIPAGTNFVSLRGDTDPTNGGWQITLNGYDFNDNLVASNTVTDVGGATLTITSAVSNIHRVVFLGSPGDTGGVVVDDFTFNPVVPSSIAVPVSTVTVGPGMLVGGGAPELASRNDEYVYARPGAVLTLATYPLQVTLTGTSPFASLREIRFEVESAATVPNLTQKVDFYNFSTNSYDQIDSRALPQSDTLITLVVVNDPSRYVQPGTLQLKVRISARAAGAVLVYPWLHRIDFARWSVIN